MSAATVDRLGYIFEGLNWSLTIKPNDTGRGGPLMASLVLNLEGQDSMDVSWAADGSVLLDWERGVAVAVQCFAWNDRVPAQVADRFEEVYA